MKKRVKELLKEKGLLKIFTDTRYDFMVTLMKDRMKSDPMLKGLLTSVPDAKVDFIADNMIAIFKNP